MQSKRVYMGLLMMITIVLTLSWGTHQAEAGILQLTKDTPYETMYNMYPDLDNHGRAAWNAYSSAGGNTIVYYNGSQCQQVGTSSVPRSYNGPWVSDGQVAWIEDDRTASSDQATWYKLYLYDGQQSCQLASSNSPIYYITSLGNGQIIGYEGDYTHGFKLMLYNGQQNKELGSSTYYYNSNNVVVLGGGKLAWLQYDSTGQNQLCIYDGLQTSVLVSSSDCPCYITDLGDGKIAWRQGSGTSGYKLCSYDGQCHDLASSSASIAVPISAGSGKMAWTQGSSTQGYQLYLYDGQQSCQLASAIYSFSSLTSLGNGQLAWTQYNTSSRIYELNLYNGQQSQVLVSSSNSLSNLRSLGSGQLAWVQYDSSSRTYKIWLYNGQSNQEVTSSSTYFSYLTALGSGQLAWTQGSYGQGKVYLYTGQATSMIGENYYSSLGYQDQYLFWVSTDQQINRYQLADSSNDTGESYEIKTPQTTTDQNKEWTINLSHAVDKASLSDQNLYIKDASGTKLAAIPYVKSSNQLAIPAPTGGYAAGSYTLYIENSLRDTSQNQLKTAVKMVFTVSTN